MIFSKIVTPFLASRKCHYYGAQYFTLFLEDQILEMFVISWTESKYEIPVLNGYKVKEYRVKILEYRQLRISHFNQSGHSGTNALSSKKLFHIDSELLRSRDWKSKEPGYLGYFCHILDSIFFFKITSFSASF